MNPVVSFSTSGAVLFAVLWFASIVAFGVVCAKGGYARGRTRAEYDYDSVRADLLSERVINTSLAAEKSYLKQQVATLAASASVAQNALRSLAAPEYSRALDDGLTPTAAADRVLRIVRGAPMGEEIAP